MTTRQPQRLVVRPVCWFASKARFCVPGLCHSRQGITSYTGESFSISRTYVLVGVVVIYPRITLGLHDYVEQAVGGQLLRATMLSLSQTPGPFTKLSFSQQLTEACKAGTGRGAHVHHVVQEGDL